MSEYERFEFKQIFNAAGSMTRDEYDSYCVNILASHVDDRYTCLRGPRPSGAILLIDDDYHSVVYGGVYPPKGSPSCKEVGKCMIVDNHCVRSIHAEVRAIVHAAAIGYPVYESTLYSWNKPCYNCTITAIAAGVKRIVYVHIVYNEEKTQQAIQNAGIICEKYEGYIGE